MPVRFLSWLLGCCALLSCGCNGWSLPRIDPTGERLLVPGGTPPPLAGTMTPPPPGVPSAQWGVSVSPSQVIAPVGSEVVMIATVMGPEGYPLSRERIEWMLAPDGAGQFVSPGRRRPLEVINWVRHLPRKVDNTYAINSTLTGSATLDRGTPTPTDDILVQSGQSYVTVTSATEGTSRLTVFAPGVDAWDRRQQTASIYWLDAQWRFPPPGIAAAGSRGTLTTVVTRQSDGSPLAGWVVRYEVVGGPAAGFAPDGATAVEVVTAATGEASAEIVQPQPAPGNNQVNIQIISPQVANQPRRPPVGSGVTFQTWTGGEAVPYSPPSQPGAAVPPAFVPIPPGSAPPPTTTAPPGVTSPPPTATPTFPSDAPVAKLEVSVSGPTTAAVGSDVQFEIQVTNRGAATATKLLVSDRFDDGLVHSMATGTVERDLVDLPPGGTTRLAVKFRVAKAGQLCQEINVSAEGGVRASTQNCITASEAPQASPSEPAQPPAEPPLQPPLEPPPAEPKAAEPEAPTTPAPKPAAARVTVTKKGPEQRKIGELALFEIEVTNAGPTAIENLEISDNFETSLEPKRASEGYEWLKGNALGWKVASLAPGGSVRYEIELRCLRETPRACNRVTVSVPGAESVADEACLEIVGEGAAAAPPAGAGAQVSVSLADTADPIKVDGQTTLQILLANKGDQSAFEVEVSVSFGEELRMVGINGPVQGSVTAGRVRFSPLRELRSGETPSFEIRFTGAKPGAAKVHVDVTSKGQTRAISADQTTEVLP